MIKDVNNENILMFFHQYLKKKIFEEPINKQYNLQRKRLIKKTSTMCNEHIYARNVADLLHIIATCGDKNDNKFDDTLPLRSLNYICMFTIEKKYFKFISFKDKKDKHSYDRNDLKNFQDYYLINQLNRFLNKKLIYL